VCVLVQLWGSGADQHNGLDQRRELITRRDAKEADAVVASAFAEHNNGRDFVDSQARGEIAVVEKFVHFDADLLRKLRHLFDDLASAVAGVAFEVLGEQRQHNRRLDYRQRFTNLLLGFWIHQRHECQSFFADWNDTPS